jgi:N-acetylglucosaminyl-diphospho-decaprenol L-rhamnosyltransferase
VDTEPLLSYCVVNTNGRDYLLACLEAIERSTPETGATEVLVLDNASDDGSADAVRERGGDIRLIAQQERRGKGENDSRLLQEARGRYGLLLNEDAELQPGAAAALVEALEADPRAATAGAQLLSPDGHPRPCAYMLPSLLTAGLGALFLHRPFIVRSGGDGIAEVGWSQSSALLVRRAAAEEVGWLDPDFFVYSDETDLCKRLHDAGWRNLHVPHATAIHHDQLNTDLEAERPRIVEFHRNRDLYMRKHHPRSAALARLLHAWSYLPRALAALVLPRQDPKRYLLHARQALRPGRGEGIRERADAYNRRLAARPR